MGWTRTNAHKLPEQFASHRPYLLNQFKQITKHCSFSACVKFASHNVSREELCLRTYCAKVCQEERVARTVFAVRRGGEVTDPMNYMLLVYFCQVVTTGEPLH